MLASMEVLELQRRYIEYNASLFDEGYFEDQFAQVQKVQASGNPGFVAEVVSVYLAESDKILNDLTIAMDQQPIDLKKVYANALLFKGSSSSLGAQRIQDVCIAFCRFCREKNTEACMRCLLRIKEEYSIVKDKLHNLLRLEREIVKAGAEVPMLKQ